MALLEEPYSFLAFFIFMWGLIILIYIERIVQQRAMKRVGKDGILIICPEEEIKQWNIFILTVNSLIRLRVFQIG